jgi:uncharacterized protein (TIGR04255 family)
MRRILKNKPLVEAIFELRWELIGKADSGESIDPHSKILIGEIYGKIKSEYPFHEQLPASEVPDRFAPYIIQHRFRKAAAQWPLVQIGPGILALNDTTGYVWEDFSQRIYNLLHTFYEIYPEPGNLKPNMVMLRYIDSVEFDYENDILKFLQDKMKIAINMNQSLFDETGISQSPFDMDLRFSFSSATPKGAMDIRIKRGRQSESNVLVWETIFRSSGNDTPKTEEEIIAWVVDAHRLTVDWFFKLIEGDLLKEFE